jgi:hypothetical protein
MNIDKKDRTQLKGYFVKNSIPTEKQFAELIDGMLNQKDDGIAKASVAEPLSIQAAIDTPTGLKKIINFYENFQDTDPAWMLQLNPRTNQNDSATAKSGFSISDGQGVSRLFIDKNTGNVGIGTVNPDAIVKLHVNGSGKFTSLTWKNSILSDDQGGSIELGGNNTVAGVGTPFIDFHFKDKTEDFNVRLINDADKRLSVFGDLNVNGSGKFTSLTWKNSILSDDQGGSIELGGNNTVAGVGTPFIDFHFKDKTEDFNVRLINDADKRLSVFGDLNVNGTLKSPMWNVTQIFNSQPGGLPKTSLQFTTGGGGLIIIASGSGYGSGKIGMDIQIDGTTIGSAYSFTNEAGSHKVFSCNALVKGGIAAGTHTIKLVAISGTNTDGNDYFNVTVLEFPFQPSSLIPIIIGPIFTPVPPVLINPLFNI